MDDTTLSPADLRRLTGISRKALRLYEARGLLTRPLRTPHGWRRYPPQVVEEVRFIRAALEVGIRLEDLKPALDAWRRGQSPCPLLAQALQRRLTEVEARLQALQRQHQRLQALVARWDCSCPPTPEVCHQVEQAVHS
ncbi:MAG: MerR family DNA-binding protein [Dehalococcoidia bacterium]|nr:MerR family DNA-binding protein [Dehalococcoidia bacterium]MDW8120001.1 MerR family DNA-binding protein [Chloroflexota bacterium]